MLLYNFPFLFKVISPSPSFNTPILPPTRKQPLHIHPDTVQAGAGGGCLQLLLHHRLAGFPPRWTSFKGELFGFCDKSYVLTITRFVAFYYSVFTGHVVGPCAVCRPWCYPSKISTWSRCPTTGCQDTVPCPKILPS